MSTAQIRSHVRTPAPKKSSSLWKWGAGAAGAALAAGAAAYNMACSRRAEQANPPIGSFIDVDGVRLHYHEQGTGPLIVLLHGNGTMIQDWIASGVFDALAKANRVLAFDRPGFGWSERPRGVIWTPAAQARLVAAALWRRGDQGATIVGHSFATLVALELALNHPDTAHSLVLIGGYYYPSARADVAFAAPPAIPVIGDIVRYTVSPLLGAAMRRRLESRMFAPGAVSQGWKSDFPFEMTLRPSQIRAAAADAALMIPAAASFASRLDSLHLPVSIMAGDGDEIVSTRDQSGRLSDQLDRAELLIVEGAGHMAHHAAPDQLAAATLATSTRML